MDKKKDMHSGNKKPKRTSDSPVPKTTPPQKIKTRIVHFLDRAIPKKNRRKYLNIFLLIQVTVILAAALIRHSLNEVLVNAFQSTTVGGLYSFISPFFLNENNPLEGYGQALQSSAAFGLWMFSGFTYATLLAYNELVASLRYRWPMRFVHGIVFSLTAGVVCVPIATLVTGAFVLPVQPLWETGRLPLRAIAVVLGAVGACLVLFLLYYALKSLWESIKESVRFYFFTIVFLFAFLAVVFLLEKLHIVGFLDGILNWFLNIAGITVTLNDQAIDAYLNSMEFRKVLIGILIFLMYNISSLRKTKELTI